MKDVSLGGSIDSDLKFFPYELDLVQPSSDIETFQGQRIPTFMGCTFFFDGT